MNAITYRNNWISIYGYWLMDIGYFCKQHSTITAQKNNKTFFQLCACAVFKMLAHFTPG